MPDDSRKGPERRKSTRLKKPFSLRLHIRGGGTFTAWDMVFIKDISRSGLAFAYDLPFKKGILLDLRINFGADRGTIDCEGEVIRVQELKNKIRHEIGVVFVNISQADQELINQAAEDFRAKHPSNA